MMNFLLLTKLFDSKKIETFNDKTMTIDKFWKKNNDLYNTLFFEKNIMVISTSTT